MSVKWISYVWENTAYEGGALLTALALADFANDEGICFPKIETLAKKARLSVRQIHRIINTFETDQFVVIDHRNGRGNGLTFHLQKDDTMSPFEPDTKPVKGDICDTEKVTFATKKVAHIRNEPSLEPSYVESAPLPTGFETQELEIVPCDENGYPLGTNFKKEKQSFGHRAPRSSRKPKAPITDPRLTHPIIVAIKDITDYYPDVVLRDGLIKRFGDNIDVPFLRKCREVWVARGYNKFAITWTDWYFDGIPERQIPNTPATKPLSKWNHNL